MGFFDNINGAIKTYPIRDASEFIGKLESFLPIDISYKPGDIIKFSQELGIDIIRAYYKNLEIIDREANNNMGEFSFNCWHSINNNVEFGSMIPTIIVNYDDYINERLSPDKHPPVMNIVRCDEYNPLLNKTSVSKCTNCKCDFRNKNTPFAPICSTSICRTLNCKGCKFTSLVRDE